MPRIDLYGDSCSILRDLQNSSIYYMAAMTVRLEHHTQLLERIFSYSSSNCDYSRTRSLVAVSFSPTEDLSRPIKTMYITV